MILINCTPTGCFILIRCYHEEIIYDYTKSSIVKVARNKELFVKESIKASKTLLPYEMQNL